MELTSHPQDADENASLFRPRLRPTLMRPEDSLVLEVASDGLTSVVDGDGVHGSSAVLTPTGAARDRGVAVAEWSHCDTKTRGTSASRSNAWSTFTASRSHADRYRRVVAAVGSCETATARPVLVSVRSKGEYPR